MHIQREYSKKALIIILLMSIIMCISCGISDSNDDVEKNSEENANTPKLIEIPNLEHTDFDSAKAALINKGLLIVIEEEYSDEFREGEVIETNPIGGAFIEENGKVTIRISKGPAPKENSATPMPTPKANDLLQWDKVSVGELITWGKYEQDNDTKNGKEDIEWLVLEKKDNLILVISRYALDCKLYNDKNADTTWASSSIRKWLNDEFLKEAFSEEERSFIPTIIVHTGKNAEYNTNAGNSTEDKIFLLSIEEAKKYFSSDDARQCKATSFASAQGAGKSSNNKDSCWWWLRSPGMNAKNAAYISSAGFPYYQGDPVTSNNDSVRPAMWIKTNSPFESSEKPLVITTPTPTPTPTSKPTQSPSPELPALSWADFEGTSEGGILRFGSYEQDNDFANGKEPIEWIVLEMKKDSALVISRYVLDRKPYSLGFGESFDWENSDIRRWLNSSFFLEAFNEKERSIIIDTSSKLYREGKEISVTDRIFLLGLDGVEKYFRYNMKCAFTEYAKAKSDNEKAWWLQPKVGDTGDYCYFAAISEEGHYLRGEVVECIAYMENGVRPVMWVRVKE